MQEQQARQFHDFLFSRQAGGEGVPNAALSAEMIDRQRSSSFVSAANADESNISSLHEINKRTFSNLSDSLEMHENGSDIKRFKPPEDISPNLNGSTIGMAKPSNNVEIEIDLTSDASEKNGGHDSYARDSTNEVQVLDSDVDDDDDDDDDTEDVIFDTPHEAVVTNYSHVRDKSGNAQATPDEAPFIHRNFEPDDAAPDKPEGPQVTTREEPNDLEMALQTNEIEIIATNTRNRPHMSLLLQAAEETKPDAVPALDGMQMLAKAMEGRAVSTGNEASDDDSSYSDTNAAKLFASVQVAMAKEQTAADNYVDTAQEAKEQVISKDPVAVMISRLPELPCEPDYDPTTATANVDYEGPEQAPDGVPLDVEDPVFLAQEETEKEEPLYYASIDTWYPSNNAIKRGNRKLKTDDTTVYELKLRNGEKINVTASMHDRLGKSAEPGAIEKLPHCKIHERMFQAQYGKLSKEPLFCSQVTEIYCTSVMLCCSSCSTWRHAECGGHHAFYSPQNREEHFKPVCDRCYQETAVIEKYPQVEKRIARQRDIHLRKTHVAADIMRHAAYAKHGGTYKWPLGSVLQCHIGGHSRSVHIRHERSEKQWKDMLHKLNSSGNASKSPRDRVKQRTKELERVLNNLEEAGKFIRIDCIRKISVLLLDFN